MQTNDAADRHELETEPALTIGKIFQDKTMIKTVVTAGIGIAASFGVTVADGVTDAYVTIVWFAALLITTAVAQAEARQRAKAQAVETRGHVYAPATVERIRAEAAPAAQPRTFVSHGPGVRPREGIRQQTNPGS